MESGKLRHALDQILRRCKAAGHRLHVFDPSDISHEEVVGRGEEGIGGDRSGRGSARGCARGKCLRSYFLIKATWYIQVHPNSMYL